MRALFFVICAVYTVFAFEFLSKFEEKEGQKNSTVMLNGIKKYRASYEVLIRSGTTNDNGLIFGGIYDKNRKLIDISDNPDATAMLKTKTGFKLVTAFEGYPGAIYIADVIKNKKGKLEIKDFDSVDFAPLGGTVYNCAGRLSPWDSFLGGEEDYNLEGAYFDEKLKNLTRHTASECDANKSGFFCSSVMGIKKYLDTNDTSSINPYQYGHIIEIAGLQETNATPHKRYALGKFAPETALVMPDMKTVYMSDDSKYGGLFMFVADWPEQLWSGSLYAAKVKMQDNKMNITWILLGKSSEAEIKTLIEKKPVFTEMFDVKKFDGSCEDGFLAVQASVFKSVVCLKPKEAQRSAAAFLESRIYAAAMNASVGFSKLEGMAYHDEPSQLYISISKIESGMSDGAGDIRYVANKCGAVFFGEISKGDISPFELKNLSPLIMGKELNTSASRAKYAACDESLPSNPDNLAIIGNTLMIGEDSEHVKRNSVWAYDLKKSKLTKIQELAFGAESTGSFASYEDKNNMYIFSNMQHPYKDETINAFGELANEAELKNSTAQMKNGVVGYMFINKALKVK
jgi:uncharacterized protein